MAVREQPDEGLPDQLLLADDDLADLGLDGAGALGERLGRDSVRLRGAGLGACGGGRGVHGSSGVPRRARQWFGSSELK